MAVFLKRVGIFFIFGIFLNGGWTLLQTYIRKNDSVAEREQVILKEWNESGLNVETGERLIDDIHDANSKDIRERLTAAYGSVSGSHAEIAAQLDSDPDRRDRVAEVLLEFMASLNFPYRVDDITLVTGVRYEKERANFVYEYFVEEDWSSKSDDELAVVRAEVIKVNPNGVCETSLEILMQGFIFTARYRDVTGSELFSITKDYKFCERLGY